MTTSDATICSHHLIDYANRVSRKKTVTGLCVFESQTPFRLVLRNWMDTGSRVDGAGLIESLPPRGRAEGAYALHIGRLFEGRAIGMGERSEK